MGLNQERKPQVQAASRFTDICPKISFQCLNLYYFFSYIWVMPFKYYFAHEWKFLMLVLWSRTSADRLYGNYWNLHLTISKWGSIILGYDFTPVSSTRRLRTNCCSLFNRQALVAAYSLDAISPPRHIMTETSVVKQPYVVTVLAASARLKHWWGCNPFKCWSHVHARPDLCHQFNWCSSTSGCNVTSRHKDDSIILYVPPVWLTIDDFDSCY